MLNRGAAQGVSTHGTKTLRGEVETRLDKVREAARELWQRAIPERCAELEDALKTAISSETDRVDLESKGEALAPAYQEWLQLRDEVERLWKEFAV